MIYWSEHAHDGKPLSLDAEQPAEQTVSPFAVINIRTWTTAITLTGELTSASWVGYPSLAAAAAAQGLAVTEEIREM